MQVSKPCAAAGAQVFRATYCESDVAVKKLNRVHDATSEEAFRHECAILKGCRNPYIVSFVGVCKDEARARLLCRAFPVHKTVRAHVPSACNM